MDMVYRTQDGPGGERAEPRALLNPQGWPEFEAVAVRGEGVFPPLKTVTRLIMDRLRGGRAVAR